MARHIYVNLPVHDLNNAMGFFAALDFAFDPKFTNDKAACMIVAENISVMLVTKPFFSTFTTKAISDANTATEVLVCLSCRSRQEVDELVRKARNAGGSVPREPQDHGFMYGHGFDDLDGHVWELVYMEPHADQQST